MLRKNFAYFNLLHKFLDLLIVFASFHLAYYLRGKVEIGSVPADGLEVWYFQYSLLLLFLNYFYFRVYELYTTKRIKPIAEEVWSTLKANSTAFLIFIILVYFISGDKLSRSILIAHFFLSNFFLAAFKISLRKFLRRMREKGYNIRYAILVGDSIHMKSYAKTILKRKEFGIDILTWYDAPKKLSENEKELFKDIISSVDYSFENASSKRPDYLIVSYSHQSSSKLAKIFEDSKNMINCETVYLPDVSTSLIGYDITNMGEFPAIVFNKPALGEKAMLIKRVFDIIFSLIGIILLSPFLFIIGLMIKFSSKGPIIYTQERMGLDGQQFKMLKFRTMVTCDKVNHQGWTVKNDPRVTFIGKILRKTSLDELPQLWNVLLGDMSLVGPRPERPQFVHDFKGKIPNYVLRLKMKAGMTGWAQVNGWRGDTSLEKRIDCDIYYIKNWSVWFDISIIFMTFWKGFYNKNAY